MGVNRIMNKNTFRKLADAKTLIIDDDEFIRDSISLVFKNRGCFLRAVETAEDGLMALEEENFDIVISDYRLPGMNGLNFFRLLAIRLPDTLRILISAFMDKTVFSDAREIGIHEFMEKPFPVEAFLKNLEALMQNRDSNATAFQTAGR